MTRRDLIHKWLVYALGLLPVWLLDAYILPRVPLWGTVPMLLPLAAACGILVVWGHRANIVRLLEGTENKFSLHKKRE